MRKCSVSVRAPKRSLLRTTALWPASIGSVVVFFAMADLAQAQEYIWGGSGSTTNTTDYNLGTNWSTGAPDAPPDTATEDATFRNSGDTTVHVTAPVTIDNLGFASDSTTSYTIDGSTITLGGVSASIIDASVGTTQTILNVIAGSTSTGTNQVVLIGDDTSTLVLGGINTYTGDTSIQGGTLKLTGSGSIANSFVSIASTTGVLDISGGTTGSTSIGGLGAGVNTADASFVNVKLGANTLNIGAVTGGSHPYKDLGSAVIGGTGGVNFGGDTVLYNTQAYTGATEITAGGLFVETSQFYSDTYGITASLANSSLVTVDAGASLQFYYIPLGGYTGTGPFTTFSIKSLAGAGDVFQDGNTLILTNASSTFSGIIGSDGLGNVASGGLTIASGTEILTGNNIYTGATTVDLGATLQLGDATASGSVAGAVVDNGTLAIKRTDAFTFGNTLSGNGAFNQIGTGTTTLTADSSAFAGSTTITAGTLIVGTDNTAKLGGAIEVDTNGTLGGLGTVGNLTVKGIVAPGNPVTPGSTPGTLNVAGTVGFDATSAYQVQVQASGAGDKIAATGAATILGGAVVVEAQAGAYAPLTTYTIVSALSRTGEFDSVSDDLAFLDASLSYDSTNVFLTLTRNDVAIADLGDTPNQRAVGAVIGNSGTTADIYLALLSQDAAGARNALDQLTGEIHASAKGMLVDDSHFIRDAVSARLAAAFGDGNTAALPVMAYGEGGPETVAADTDRFAVWSQAFGAWGETDSDGNAASFSRSTGGLLVGADALAGDWRLGLLGGYSHTSFDADARNSAGDSDNYHLGLYAGTTMGNLALRTGAAYSWHRISTARNVDFGGFADQLSADYDAATAQAFGELAYDVKKGRFAFEPFANLAYVSLHSDGFTEQGGDAALSSGSSTTDTTFTTLGVRASTEIALGTMTATARGMLGWRHAFGDVTPLSTFAFAGGDPFTIAGAPIARDAALLETGLDLQLAANATLAISYDGQFGGGAHDNGVKANIGVRF
jgi:outer membrane autotransporter protein